MALSEADIEQFIEALHNSADLRERARAAILSDDFQALPRTMDRLGERMDQLAERMDQLTERMDQLAERMDRIEVQVGQLAAALKSIDGRVGRLEGWRFETKYPENLASHLVERFDRPRLLVAGNVAPLVSARREGRFSKAEWGNIIALNVLATATDISLPEHPEVYVAIELSMVIDESDIERARERAGILARALDLPVVACVDGEAILRDAEFRAAELNVVNLRG